MEEEEILPPGLRNNGSNQSCAWYFFISLHSRVSYDVSPLLIILAKESKCHINYICEIFYESTRWKGFALIMFKKISTCANMWCYSQIEQSRGWTLFFLCHDNFSISNFQFSYCSLFPAVCALLLLEEQQNNIEIRNKNGQVPVEREKYLLWNTKVKFYHRL